MSHRNSFRTTRSLFFALVILLFGGLIIACGGEDDDPSAGPREYESIELGEILPADESHFDVDWAPETIVADEADVWNDLEDLQPYDGVFRVASGSSLLAGVEEGSIVMWPQVGIFEILSLDDQGDIVEVETQWASFGAAMDRADISFGHALESGESGRVVGVRAASDEDDIQQGVRVQPLNADAGPLEYSDEGLQYSGTLGQYGLDTNLGISGDTISVGFSTSSGPVTASVDGQVSGMRAEGLVFLDPEDEDPSVVINFQDITLNVDVSLSVKGADGSAEVKPQAVVTFPFMIGPIPAYIAVGLRIQVRAAMGSGDTLVSATSGFTMSGSVTVARNDDGGFGAEGSIDSFDARSPGISFDTSITSGIGLDVDTPRISFGMGRPGLASASIYGTHSMELVANATVDATSGDYCAAVGTGSAILAGGELSMFGWSAGREYQIANRSGPERNEGALCQ